MQVIRHLLTVGLLLASPVLAGTLDRATGCEVGGLQEFTSTTGTPACIPGALRTGTYGLRLNAAEGVDILLKTSVGSGVGVLAEWEFLTDDTTPGSEYDLMSFESTAGDIFARLRHETDGDIAIVDANNMIQATITNPLSVSTWHNLALWVQNSDTGNGEFWIDGTSQTTLTSEDFRSGTASIEVVTFTGVSGLQIHIDDVVTHSPGVVGDRLGGTTGVEVYVYQNDHATATDIGSALTDGTWDELGHLPIQDGNNDDAEYVGGGNLSGSTDYDDGSRAGPNGDANIDTVVGVTYWWWWERSNGSGETYHLNYGNNSDGTTQDTSLEPPASFGEVFISSTAATVMPTESEYCRQGFGENGDGGRDPVMGEMYCFIVNKPDEPAGGDPRRVIFVG